MPQPSTQRPSRQSSPEQHTSKPQLENWSPHAAEHVPSTQPRFVQQSREVSHVSPAGLHPALLHTPSWQRPEQQSPSRSHPTSASRQPAIHVSSTQTLPPQHAISARQCSPAGAHAHDPAIHANEQQSLCVVHATFVRAQFAPGCHELHSQFGSASAIATARRVRTRGLIGTGTRRPARRRTAPWVPRASSAHPVARGCRSGGSR